MKGQALLFVALIGLCPARSLAAEETVDPAIAKAFDAIHQHVCTELNEPSCPPALTDDEQWAFVKTWCKRRPDDQGAGCAGLPTSGGPAVIAFDHDGRGWRPIHGVEERDVELDANGVPKVLTSSGRRVIAVVESTNPLAYKAEAGAITETDVAAVAGIKKLFEKLGPAVAALSGQAKRLISDEESTTIQAAQTAATGIVCVLDRSTAAREFTQHVEDRESASYLLLRKVPQCPADRAALALAFAQLEAAAKIEFCVADVEEIVEWVEMPPTDIKALRDKQKEIDLDGACDERLHDFKALRDLRLDQLAAGKLSAETWSKDAAADRRTLSKVRAAAEVVTASAALVTKEKRAEIEAIFDNLRKFERRLIESAATTTTNLTDGNFDTAEVADFFVVRHGAIVVAWAKNRSRTLTITKASPFTGVSTNRPDSLATSYGAASLAASLTDMNVALTHTDIQNPVFGVVSEPAPTAADPNATRTVIARTDEESRSGDLAVTVAFPVFYRWFDGAWARRLGLELGAGATTTTPAVFLGVTAKLGGGVRLGVGVTRQQIKELNGQHEGDPVKAATDIKLHDVSKDSWYASFSVSLESIGSLFQAD